MRARKISKYFSFTFKTNELLLDERSSNFNDWTLIARFTANIPIFVASCVQLNITTYIAASFKPEAVWVSQAQRSKKTSYELQYQTFGSSSRLLLHLKPVSSRHTQLLCYLSTTATWPLRPRGFLPLYLLYILHLERFKYSTEGGRPLASRSPRVCPVYVCLLVVSPGSVTDNRINRSRLSSQVHYSPLMHWLTCALIQCVTSLQVKFRLVNWLCCLWAVGTMTRGVIIQFDTKYFSVRRNQ